MNAAPARQMAVPTILATLLRLLTSTFSSLRAGRNKTGVRILGCYNYKASLPTTLSLAGLATEPTGPTKQISPCVRVEMVGPTFLENETKLGEKKRTLYSHLPDDGGDGEGDAGGEVGGGPGHGRRSKVEALKVEVLTGRAVDRILPIESETRGRRRTEQEREGGREGAAHVLRTTHVAREAAKRRPKPRAPTAMGRSVHPLVASDARRSVAAAIPWR